jgi:predicted Rossmann fold flavoprotein
VKIVIIGAGAAGFFAAITAARSSPENKVILLEKTRHVLSKVRISGGGRCNVTHSCFDPALLIHNYPRGSQALRGPFTRFQPRDTIQWFETHGVSLKTEDDGRIFPVTDSSATIIDCLTSQATASGVQLLTEWHVTSLAKKDSGFRITNAKNEVLECDRLLLATGSSPTVYNWARDFGHQITPPVPSLFTFNIPDSPLLELAGISVPEAHLTIIDTSLEQTGPLLITHWGFSGPAVLKLSAWGARILHDCAYKATLRVNWVPQLSQEQLRQELLQQKKAYPSRLVGSESAIKSIPRNLWKKLTMLAGIDATQRWALLSNQELHLLIEQLHRSTYRIDGKSTYKEEFVTCGGVALNEVDFKTMESRICPGLYFAGEILDIDGVTGGFNFQNAWTTGWIAGQAIGR